MIRKAAAAAAMTLLASVASPQSELQRRQQAIAERHDPKDYYAELKGAIARFVTPDGTDLAALTPEELGFEIREGADSAHPIRVMLLQEMTYETRPTSSGGTVTTSRGRPRGVVVIVSSEGRMNVETHLTESEIRARPRRVYEVMPSRFCPQVLATFDIRGEAHTPDREELKTMAAWDARLPELLEAPRASAQKVERRELDDSPSLEDPAVHHIRPGPVVRFGEELPALTERETQAAASILRSPSSYIDGMSGCMFDPIIALKFPTRENLAVLVCFSCRQLRFVRGKENFGGRDLNDQAAQALLDVVRRVMPGLPGKLRE